MNSLAEIILKNHHTGERRIYRVDQDRVIFGRDASNFIVMEGRAVSRRHAEILYDSGGQQFFIRDLKSNNGTLLNESPLKPQEKALLRDGDVIQLEGYDLHFHIPDANEAQDIYEVTDTDLLEVKMVKKLIRAMDREKAPTIEVLEGPRTGLRFVLEEKNQEVVVGRDPACEFVVDSDVISRKHARLEKRFDSVLLHDLGSKNGTFVNRERLEKNSARRLQDGDVLHLGTLALSFRNPQELSFDFEPPKVETPPQESSAPKPAVPAPEESSFSDSQPPKASEPPQTTASGGRGSRKKAGQKTKLKPHEAQSPDEGAASLESPADNLEAFPQPGLEPSPQEEVADDGGNRFSLSITEILAIGVGLLVLIGSIWGIVKLLG